MDLQGVPYTILCYTYAFIGGGPIDHLIRIEVAAVLPYGPVAATAIPEVVEADGARPLEMGKSELNI